MDAILSFMIAFLFVGWIVYLKRQVDMLDKRLSQAFPVSLKILHPKTASAAGLSDEEASNLSTTHDRDAVAAEKPMRKNGVRTWTIE